MTRKEEFAVVLLNAAGVSFGPPVDWFSNIHGVPVPQPRID
jgi:hypothetical protein